MLKMKRMRQKQVFVIVLFIIGHTGTEHRGRMEGHVPRSPSEGPFDETSLDVDEIESQGNHWSLERSQDRCGTLDPVQACPDGRRAHACS